MLVLTVFFSLCYYVRSALIKKSIHIYMCVCMCVCVYLFTNVSNYYSMLLLCYSARVSLLLFFSLILFPIDLLSHFFKIPPLSTRVQLLFYRICGTYCYFLSSCSCLISCLFSPSSLIKVLGVTLLSNLRFLKSVQI